MIRMKVEDHHDGATNLISWKSRVFILEESDLLKLSMRMFKSQTLKKTKVSLEEEWCESKKNLGRLSERSLGSSNLAKELD